MLKKTKFLRPDATEEDQAEILRRSSRLLLPTSFWKGRPEKPPICPASILLFHRLKAAELMTVAHHQHHRFILIANLGGMGKIALDAKMHPLRERQTLLIFPFQSHCYVELCPPALHWIFISFEHPREPRLESLRNLGALNLDERGLIQLRNLLRAWQSASDQEALPLHLGLWLHQMIQTVAKAAKPASPKKVVADRREDLVARVNQLVFDNRHRPLSIEQLASHLGVSVSSLRNRFHAATGRSVGRHAREIRLNYACELLHDTQLRIEEIGVRCGYESLFAFSRAFQKSYGCYPSHYRKTKIGSSLQMPDAIAVLQKKP